MIGTSVANEVQDYIQSEYVTKWCIEFGIDMDDVLEMFAVIDSYFHKAEAINPFMQRELYLHMRNYEVSHQNMSAWFSALRKINKMSWDQNERCSIDMISYLVLAESWYEAVVDRLCCLLVKIVDKHPFKPDNAKNCDGISRESLGTKRKFLKSCGLERISDAFDNQIRNASGHQSFEIRGNEAYIHKIDKTIDPRSEYMKLQAATMSVFVAFRYYYELRHGPYSHFSDDVFTTPSGIDMVKRTVAGMIHNPGRWHDIAHYAESRFRRQSI